MSMTDGGNDGGGGGLGTASSICTISPEDTTAVLGNLISRIEKLEFNLSQILGANLHANQLSDLSSQVGWVYNVEYMGVPGWIQTEYGTLIPPAGFTMSTSGIQLFNSCTGEFEDYQAVVMDSDGVLRWGASTAGNLCGSKVEEWDAAAANVSPDYYIYRQGIAMATSNPYEAGRNTTRHSDTGLATDEGFTLNVLLSNAGLYEVSVGGMWSISRSGSQTGITTNASINARAYVGSSNNYGYASQSEVDAFTYIGGVGDPNLTVETAESSATLTHIFDVPAGALIECEASFTPVGSYSVNQRTGIYVTIVRIGTGAN